VGAPPSVRVPAHSRSLGFRGAFLANFSAPRRIFWPVPGTPLGSGAFGDGISPGPRPFCEARCRTPGGVTCPRPPAPASSQAAAKFSDLGADSLDTVEIMMAPEEKFDIQLAEEGAENISTVGEAANMIVEQMK